MNWGVVGAIAGAAGNQLRAHADRETKRQERIARIKEALSLTNAQAEPRRRVIPGEAPPNGMGPPSPERVEEYVPQYVFDEETGEYKRQERSLSSRPNQWAQSDVSIQEAGGKVLTKRKERDLAGNERMSIEESAAAPKQGGRTEADRYGYLDRTDELQRDRARSSDEMQRRRIADAAVAARMREFNDYDAKDVPAVLAKYGVADMSGLRAKVRAQEYENLGVDQSESGNAPAADPPAVQRQPKPLRRPAQTAAAGQQKTGVAALPPEVQAMIKQAKANGYTDQEIADQLRADGLLK